MKKKLFSASALLLFSAILSAQGQVFVYTRTNGVIRLVNESDTISFFNYRLTENGSRERQVEMGDQAFIMSVSKRSKDRTQTISDANGIKYATVSLGSKNRYDVSMEDGAILECTVKGKSWIYSSGGKEVIKVSVKREGGKKKILINGDTLTSISPVVVLSALERATDRYVSSAATTPVIVSAALLALIRTAMMNDSEPQY